jgi:ubiquitin-protein ligase
MSMVRLRRLQSDFERLASLISKHPRLQCLKVEGDPPERYQLEYKVRSLRQKDGELLEVGSHVVEIHLPRDYPRTPPLCRMLTPVFHPNIAPHAICIGDHWSAGESLAALVTRIGEMLAYQSYNTKSPLNGEAAKWTAQNLERLPLDAVNMHIEETHPSPAVSAPSSAASAPFAASGALPAPPLAASRTQTASPAPPAPAPSSASPPTTKIVTCPGCGAKVRVNAATATSFRCPRCKSTVPAS